MVGAVVHHNDPSQRGHGFALNVAILSLDVADNLLQQGPVAAAPPRAIGEIGDGADDEDLCAEVAQRGLDLLGVEARVQGHQHGAELEEGIRQGGELGGVAEGNGHAVAFADAEGGEGGGEAVGGAVEVVVAEGCFEGGRGG